MKNTLQIIKANIYIKYQWTNNIQNKHHKAKQISYQITIYIEREAHDNTVLVRHIVHVFG